MKLSDADFRPKHRSRTVRKPAARRPILRILLLLGLGALAYFQFDRVWNWMGTWFQRPAKSGTSQSEIPSNTAITWTMEEGGEARKGYCQGDLEACWEEVDVAYPGLGGHLQSLQSRIISRGYKPVEASQWSWSVLPSDKGRVTNHPWILASLNDGRSVWRRHALGSEFTYCRNESDCLSEPLARLPLLEGYGRAAPTPPYSIHWRADQADVYPLWKGLVRAIDTLNSGSLQVIVDHGRLRTVAYGGLSQVHNLKPGTEVLPGKSLGSAHPDGSGRFEMELTGKVADTPVDGFFLFPGCERMEWDHES